MQPKANPANILIGENCRITLLTDSLIRFEYSPEHHFEDRASQKVWFRDLGEVPFREERSGRARRILTDALVIRFEEGPHFLESLAVTMRSAQRSCEIPWTYGKKCENLFGTARTLDTADGPIPLEEGILSADGRQTHTTETKRGQPFAMKFLVYHFSSESFFSLAFILLRAS